MAFTYDRGVKLRGPFSRIIYRVHHYFLARRVPSASIGRPDGGPATRGRRNLEEPRERPCSNLASWWWCVPERSRCVRKSIRLLRRHGREPVAAACRLSGDERSRSRRSPSGSAQSRDQLDVNVAGSKLAGAIPGLPFVKMAILHCL